MYQNKKLNLGFSNHRMLDKKNILVVILIFSIIMFYFCDFPREATFMNFSSFTVCIDFAKYGKASIQMLSRSKFK